MQTPANQSTTTHRRIALDQLSIASPCHARWEDMEGDSVQRFCPDCRLHVHDISAMTEPQAHAFLAGHSGDDRACIRMFKRADGKVLTQDCPVGLRLVRLKLTRSLSRAAALLAAIVGGSIAFAGERSSGPMEFRRLAPFRWIVNRISPRSTVILSPIMGKLCGPAPSIPVPQPALPMPAPIPSSQE